MRDHQAVDGRVRRRSSGLDERFAALAGSVAIRLSLIRMALRPRDDIPELIVLALEHEGVTVDVPEAKRLVRGQARG